MATSILTSTKKVLGIEALDTSFDTDILMHINSVLATLNQIGVGPENGYHIEDDDATWDDYLASDSRLNSVQSYMYLKVRLLFDPPATSFAIQAMQENAKELEYRIYMVGEVDKAL